MFVTRVMQGNPLIGYSIVSRQEFNTDFAAALYGWLMCRDAPDIHYWVIE